MSDPFSEYIKSEDALFHYTRSDRALLILREGKLKLSLKGDMIDPNEFLPASLGFTRDVSSSSFDLNAGFRESDKVWGEIKWITERQSRIVCFCSNKKPFITLPREDSLPDPSVSDLGWAKSRMWIQYGEEHKGCCLVFSQKALEQKAFPDTQRWNEPVWYRKGLKESQLPDIGAIRDRGASKYAHAYVVGAYHDLFFEKDIDFRDECEYRLVVIDPSSKFGYLDISDSIKGVIVGYRASRVQQAHIKSCCDQLSLWSGLASWVGGFPSLEFLLPDYE